MESPAVFASALAMAVVFGATWGSFLNVCIARLPRGMSVVRPPSHCFACGSPVRARDNIPILSYFLLRGRCRSCGARFSGRHALVEALTGGLCALVLWSFVLDAPGVPLGVRVARFAVYFAFAAVLVVLTFIDLDTKRLPDVITLPSIAVFFLGGFATGEVGMARSRHRRRERLPLRARHRRRLLLQHRPRGAGAGRRQAPRRDGGPLGLEGPAAHRLRGFVGRHCGQHPPSLVQRRRRRAEPQAVATAPPIAPAPVSIRRAEVPFGPFLSASALGYLFLHRQIWALIERIFLGG